MKRELKFKAWHKEEKVLCDIKVLTDEGAFLVGVKKGKDVIDGRAIIYAPEEGRFCKHDEIEIIQYTGKKDENGKEIYEGDIRKGNFFCMNDPCEVIDVMGFWSDEDHCGFQWKNIRGGRMPDFIGTRIIGNIFETPELLK